MKKKIFLGLTILVLSLPFTVAAQSRGALSNIFASWYSVTTTQITITLPFNSRDITIHNGSTNAICVDLKGGTIPASCVSASGSNPSIIQLDGNTALSLSDYLTSAISLKAISATASPVSVVITY